MKYLFDENLNKNRKSKDDINHATGSIEISMKEIATSDGFIDNFF